MKKITAFIISLVLIFSAVVTAAAEAGVTENASKPAVRLECVSDAAEGGIIKVKVSLEGCMGLESADLKFRYDSAKMTYLGASLIGAAAADPDLYAVFSESDESADGAAAVSLFHMNALSPVEGNGEFCELAFAASGGGKVKAEKISFVINGEEVDPSLGSCRYSEGLGSFFKTHGSALLVAAVIAVIIIVLLVLLLVVRNMKKKIGDDTAKAELFDADEAEEKEAGAGESVNETADKPVDDAVDETVDKTAADEPDGSSSDSEDIPDGESENDNSGEEENK